MLRKILITWVTRALKMAGPLLSPNGIIRYSNWPSGVLITVFYSSPHRCVPNGKHSWLSLENTLALSNCLTTDSLRANRYSFFSDLIQTSKIAARA